MGDIGQYFSDEIVTTENKEGFNCPRSYAVLGPSVSGMLIYYLVGYFYYVIMLGLDLLKCQEIWDKMKLSEP